MATCVVPLVSCDCFGCHPGQLASVKLSGFRLSMSIQGLCETNSVRAFQKILPEDKEVRGGDASLSVLRLHYSPNFSCVSAEPSWTLQSIVGQSAQAESPKLHIGVLIEYNAALAKFQSLLTRV